jgi:hypothetical protein
MPAVDVTPGSTRSSASVAAMYASTALPPRERVSIPIRVAVAWLVATIAVAALPMVPRLLFICRSTTSTAEGGGPHAPASLPAPPLPESSDAACVQDSGYRAASAATSRSHVPFAIARDARTRPLREVDAQTGDDPFAHGGSPHLSSGTPFTRAHFCPRPCAPRGA